MKKAIIMMIEVFALGVWPFSGVWQLLSGIIGGGVRESFIYPIYGGIILLSGIIVVCTELILEEIKSLKDDIKDKKEGCWQLPACRIVKNQDLLEELTKAKSEEEYSCQKNT